eukprot:CAMPEP_0170173742 /NCGR_PEP_ID=MMETSP0040_2-20121228/7013_1 /TAXON_ID=641309 /ORGANISM="Lotharella oceanica, Strain CCMP622" /LENGTH=69 /DNA_ID=CAMNT_0010415065 /DNA_START=86 /DNA_END=295 /DNA_ORIENTATION=-
MRSASCAALSRSLARTTPTVSSSSSCPFAAAPRLPSLGFLGPIVVVVAEDVAIIREGEKMTSAGSGRVL